MNSERLKTVVIVVLIIIVIALGAYSLFGKDGFKNTETSTQFIKDAQVLQASLSYYLGTTYSDTFGVYTRLEILSGKANNKDGEVIDIKDNEDKNLPSIVNVDEKLENGNNSLYKVQKDTLKTVFDIDLEKYNDIDFYVQEDGMIKVNFEKEPDWWKNEFSALKVNI